MHLLNSALILVTNTTNNQLVDHYNPTNQLTGFTLITVMTLASLTLEFEKLIKFKDLKHTSVTLANLLDLTGVKLVSWVTRNVIGSIKVIIVMMVGRIIGFSGLYYLLWLLEFLVFSGG